MLVWEGQAAIHYKDFVMVSKNRHILANLANATQENDFHIPIGFPKANRASWLLTVLAFARATSAKGGGVCHKLLHGLKDEGKGPLVRVADERIGFCIYY